MHINMRCGHADQPLYHQEARRAAGKAFDVPWVDDRVNKAVAAANKAAEAARAAAVKAVQNHASNIGVGIPNLLV